MTEFNLMRSAKHGPATPQQLQLANGKFNGFSADSVAFGMGGALLQQINRDTFKFAMKTSAVYVNGAWRDAFKAPATDPGKRSKPGRISAWRNATTDEIVTARLESSGWADRELECAGSPAYREVLRPVWRHGELLHDATLAEIRSHAAAVRPGLPAHWQVI